MLQTRVITGDSKIPERPWRPDPYLTNGEVRAKVSQPHPKPRRTALRGTFQPLKWAGFRFLVALTGIEPSNRQFILVQFVLSRCKYVQFVSPDGRRKAHRCPTCWPRAGASRQDWPPRARSEGPVAQAPTAPGVVRMPANRRRRDRAYLCASGAKRRRASGPCCQCVFAGVVRVVPRGAPWCPNARESRETW